MGGTVRLHQPADGRTLAVYGLFLLLGMAVWSSAVHDGIVDHDTPWLVRDNPILSTGDFSWLARILWGMDTGTRQTLGAEYLPLRDLSVLADFALWGTDWAWHHAVNVALYMSGCLLLLSLFRQLLGPGLPAWLGAALFMLHPVHVESVAWLASRKDVLSLAFAMLSLRLWCCSESRSWALPLALLGTLMATWSKNTAVILPLLLLPISLLHLKADYRRPSWWLRWIPFAMLLAVTVALSMKVGAQMAMYTEPRGNGVSQLILLECRVITRYLGMLLWPASLAVAYQEPVAGTLFDCLLPAALLLAMLLSLRRIPMVSLGLAWFFISLLPVSQVVPIQNLMADRYLLLPSAGLVLAAMAAVAAIPVSQRISVRLSGFLVGTTVLVLLALLTIRQNHTWRSSVDLWTRAMEVSPRLPAVRVSLAGALQAQGHGEQALGVLEQAMDDLGEEPHLLQAMGGTMLLQGRPSQAEPLLRRALDLDSGLRKAAHNLARLLLQQGRTAEALQVAAGLTTRRPRYSKGWNVYGVALMQSGDPAGARAAFLQSLELAPFSREATCNMGGASWMQGDAQEARTWWSRCLQLDPGNSLALQGLARLENDRGPWDRGARAHEEPGERPAPENPETSVDRR